MRKINRDLCPLEDHFGNIYDSFSKMCANYNIKSSIVRDRLTRGWELRDALTTPKRENIYFDHLGNKYSSLEKLCSVYSISADTFNKRMQLGWELKDILLTPTKGRREYEDGNGNKFTNLKKLCKANNVPTHRTIKLIKSGVAPKDAIEIIKNSKVYTLDHNGNKFNSMTEMCNYYGISHQLLKSRLDSGMSLGSALTTKIGVKSLGELTIYNKLIKNKIKFMHNKTIKSMNNIIDFGRLTCDFYLFQYGIIEFDGEHHFTPWRKIPKNKQNSLFSKIIERDSRKTSLCEKYNIPLLRIRFDQIKQVEYLIDDFIQNNSLYIKDKHNALLKMKDYYSIRKDIIK